MYMSFRNLTSYEKHIVPQDSKLKTTQVLKVLLKDFIEMQQSDTKKEKNELVDWILDTQLGGEAEGHEAEELDVGYC